MASRSPYSSHLPLLLVLITTLLLITPVLASSGDRNPTFQHCLKGCQITYCDPSQPPIAAYLRAFGWTCEENCRYSCGHSFTDNIRRGSRWHQFYGKWPFYRFGPIQEPVSVLLSLGNLYVNLIGLGEVRRRVRSENRLRVWLVALALVQANTWVWSAVFHSRDTPFTERLDYFSATLTISFSLLYTAARTLLLQTPTSTSKLLLPVAAGITFLVISHFTYLLSFPVGQFPYGYHTKFNVMLGLAHNLLWILWSVSFIVKLPSFSIGQYTIGFPKPYPPRNPLDKPRPADALTPLALVILTLLAMSFELLDFAPIGRLVDAHAVWHACTIPLGLAWWRFLANDAIELEGSMMGRPSYPSGEKMPLSGGSGGGNSTSLSASTGLSGGNEVGMGMGRKSMSAGREGGDGGGLSGVANGSGSSGAGGGVPHYVQVAQARGDEKLMRD